MPMPTTPLPTATPTQANLEMEKGGGDVPQPPS